ncbi:MAG: PfkB family carbohydrate kinase [bacterium]
MVLDRLQKILSAIREVKIGVIGDFCLDAYWEIHEDTHETSIETGKSIIAVSSQRYSLGGAGNVIHNVVTLGAGNIHAFGVLGNDLFGNEVIRQLATLGVNCSGMIIQSLFFDTPVYAKPFLSGVEQRRIDFGGKNTLGPQTADILLESVKRRLPHLDALIVNEQLLKSIYTPSVIAMLNEAADGYREKLFLLDSRDRTLDFHHMMYKINAIEAARIFGKSVLHNEDVPVEELQQYARLLYERFEKPVYISRSSLGLLLFDGTSCRELPAHMVSGPIDPVGAGDTTVAAIACALAAGASLDEAGVFANLAAAVAIRKLKLTGTATPGEILHLASS